MWDEYIGSKSEDFDHPGFEQELKMELLKEEIKKLRKEKKLTQSQLGEKIGVQRAQISKLENNSKNMTIETLIKVLNALGAQISFTINRTEQVI